MPKYAKKVALMLSKIASEGQASVSGYADPRLRAILSVRGVSLLIKEALEDDLALKEIAERSYTHSNGFDKITLLSLANPELKLRLHVRWPSSVENLWKEAIHSHRWFFWSSILCGGANVEIYTEKTDGIPMFQYEYFPRNDGLEMYDLKPVGQSRLASDLMLKLVPGSTYSMSPQMLHRVTWGDDCISASIFVRWASVVPKAKVFSESKVMDKKMLVVPSLSVEQLREKLRALQTHILAMVKEGAAATQVDNLLFGNEGMLGN